MQIKPIHIEAASRLVDNADDFNLTPAGSGYLAAVEALTEDGNFTGDQPQYLASCKLRNQGILAYVSPLPPESDGDEAELLRPLTGDAPIVIALADGPASTHVYVSPDELRGFAYAALVLADAAEVTS